MAFIIAFMTLLLFQLAGEVLVHLFAIPLPGPLAGMLLLLLALIIRKRVPPALATTSSWLVSHLMLLFIPAVAGVMVSFDQLKKEWLPFIVAGIVGTLITQVVSAYCLSWFLKRRRSHESI